MLWRSSTLIGSGVRATDGEIGSISDLLFDETDWTVRWVVVDTGTRPGASCRPCLARWRSSSAP